MGSLGHHWGSWVGEAIQSGWGLLDGDGRLLELSLPFSFAGERGTPSPVNQNAGSEMPGWGNGILHQLCTKKAAGWHSRAPWHVSTQEPTGPHGGQMILACGGAHGSRGHVPSQGSTVAVTVQIASDPVQTAAPNPLAHWRQHQPFGVHVSQLYQQK